MDGGTGIGDSKEDKMERKKHNKTIDYTEKLNEKGAVLFILGSKTNLLAKIIGEEGGEISSITYESNRTYQERINNHRTY